MPEPAARTQHSGAREEEYQAALNMLSLLRQEPFSDNAPTAESGPVYIEGQSMPITTQSIKDANEPELERMQQQLQELQAKISNKLRMRNGENNSARCPSNTQKVKQAALSESSNQHIEVSEKPGDDADATTVKDRANSSNPGILDLVAASDDEDPTEAAQFPAIQNGIPLKRSTASRTPQQSEPNGVAPPSSGEEMMAETALERDPTVKGTVDKTVDQSVDVALTPPADTTKDGDDISTKVPIVKPTSNGAETPETIIAEPATSPPEADAMDLDAYDHS